MLSTSLTIPPAATLNAVAERKLVAAGVRSVVPVIFGTDFASGSVLNVLPAGAGSTTLLVQVLWGHGTLGGIDQERLNDVALPAGSTVTHFLGSQTGTHAPLVAGMAAQGITYTATLNGFAYSVFAIPIRSFTGQLNFTARVQGLRLYDPRLDSTNGGAGAHRLADPSTWATSDNPALADARWLTDTVFGCGETVNWPSVITTANACDALVGTPAEKRRIIGLTIDRPSRVADIAEALRAYAGCWHVPGASGIRLVPDTTGTSQASYSHTAGTLLRMGPLVARDIGGAPTAVEVIYTDTSKRPVRDGVAIASLPGAGTTLPYRPSQVRLPGIARYSQALREATERLNKLNLGDIGTDIEFLDEGIRHEVGDLIDLSHPVGLTAKVFRLAAPPELVSRGRYRAPVVEYDPAMYSSTVATAPTVPDTLLINPAGPPPDVSGMGATAIPGAIRLTWPQKPVGDIDVMQIRRGASWAAGVRLENGAAGSTEVDGTTYDWLWPASGSYTLWFRWRDRDGNLSVTAVALPVTVTAEGIEIGASQLGVQLGGGNLLTNSSFEVDSNLDGLADSWTADSAGSTGTIARTRVPGMRGTTAQRIDCAALGTSAADWAGQWQRFRCDNLGASPLSISAWALGTAGTQAVIVARFYSDIGAATQVGADLTASRNAPTGQWERLTASGVIPGGAVWCYVWIRVAQRTSVGAAQLNFDDVQAEIGDVATAWSAQPEELAAITVAGRNLLSNGGFDWDSNADGLPDSWDAEQFGTTGTVTREVVPGIGNGGALRITAAGLGTTAGDVVGISQRVRVDSLAGQPITLSASALFAATGNPKLRYVVRFYSDLAASVQVGSDITTGTVAAPTVAMTRLSCSGVIPSGALWAYVFLRMTQRDTAGLAQCNFDEAMLQISAYPTAFAPRADELLPGVVGTIELTADAATSIYVAYNAGPSGRNTTV